MIDFEKILADLSALPQDAQQQAADFIAFLRSRAQTPPPRSVEGDLEKEGFIGMWRERKDLQDSNRWVRNVRHSEWSK